MWNYKSWCTRTRYYFLNSKKQQKNTKGVDDYSDLFSLKTFSQSDRPNNFKFSVNEPIPNRKLLSLCFCNAFKSNNVSEPVEKSFISSERPNFFGKVYLSNASTYFPTSPIKFEYFHFETKIESTKLITKIQFQFDFRQSLQPWTWIIKIVKCSKASKTNETKMKNAKNQNQIQFGISPEIYCPMFFSVIVCVCVL